MNIPIHIILHIAKKAFIIFHDKLFYITHIIDLVGSILMNLQKHRMVEPWLGHC